MSKIIITIGREKGSGGHYIGDLLAKELGIRCYDKELLAETARISGFSKQFIEKYEEKKPSSLLYTLASGMSSNTYSYPLHQQVFLAQSNAIREIAERESCVFIGRCADYVLRERTDVLNCFVHAPAADRIERIIQQEQIRPAEAEMLMLRTDRDRASYYTYFTDHTWGASKSYHLSFDTSKTTIPGAVNLILEFIKTAKR